MNPYGAKAKLHLMEYCPSWYSGIEDKEAYFTEIGIEAQRQASSVYSKISKPELGENDVAAWQMANETVNELIYPTPEESEEDFDEEANPTAVRLNEWNKFLNEILNEDEED